MSVNEWAFMQSQADTRALAATIKPKSTLSSLAGRFAGITPIALYGHTPGHVGYEILSRGQGCWTLATSLIARSFRSRGPIGRSTMTPIRPKAGAGSGWRLELERLADSHEFIFAPHFPFPAWD